MQSRMVHVHLDDDVIYPDFYRAHMLAHSIGSCGASVSLRWVTAGDGTPIASLPLPDFLDSHNERVVHLDAKRLFTSTVPRCENWLGELTNTVLSDAGVRHALDGTIGGIPHYGLSDIGTLLSVSREHPVVLIRDHLSGFRSHPQQSTANIQSFGLRCGYIAWIAIALAAWRDQYITADQMARAILITLERIHSQYPNDESFRPLLHVLSTASGDLDTLYASFRSFWLDWLENDTDSKQKSDALPAEYTVATVTAS